MAENSSPRGHITLIRLQNFMTYDFIELKPGFHLNLIIGPNGTGKSSFVCAVMLAFNAKLKSVGRADSIKSFIKNGCNEATIEVELYDPLGKNLTICRKIDRQGNSQFCINGKNTNSNKINEVRKLYNINMDNLCSFLPQEKVQDFSKLTPQQLLEQTQKAAGSEGMTNDYFHLKDLLTEIKSKRARISSLTEEVNDLQQKNERIKDRVMVYIENIAMCEKETLLKQKKAWLLYFKALEEYNELTDVETTMRREYEVIERDYNKNSRTVHDLQVNTKAAQRRINHYMAVRARIIDNFRNTVKHLRDSVTRYETLDNFAELQLFEDEKKMTELKQHQETLDKLTNDLHTFVKKNGTNEQLIRREKRVNKDIEVNRKKESEMMEMRAFAEDDLEQLKTDIKNISLEYQLLEKRKNFRLEYLKRYEPDVYTSVEWLKENRYMFRSHVFDPMLLELDITDVKYAKYVEARVAFRDLISFMCTNPDDLNLLIRKLRTEKGLKVNAISSYPKDPTQYRPEIPLEKIRCFGFYIYMRDFITGPIEIIQYLCRVYNIHKIPIGNEKVRRNCDKVPLPIQLFFSENHMFLVKISLYSGEKSITVKQLKEPKIFSVLMNIHKYLGIIYKERELVSKVGEKETRLKLAEHFLKRLHNKQEELGQLKRNILTMMTEKESIENQVKRAERIIAELEQRIKGPDDIKEEMNKERSELKTKINWFLDFIDSHLSELMEYRNPPREEELRRDIIGIHMERALRTKREVTRSFDRCKFNIDTYTRKSMMKKIECTTFRDDAKALTRGVSPGNPEFETYQRAFNTVNSNLTELDAELEQIRVATEFMGSGDAEMKAEYDERNAKIEELSALLNNHNEILTKLEAEFDEALTRWLAPVNEMVTKINDLYGNFFETMGCVGEVRLISGADKEEFDKYGIEIRVKFRDEVPLHPLGRHFQSGGERAVATAVYLLALQEMANVPFRFVDEINQGMDPINEKRIVDLMIKVTDQKDSVQYFFITPKLCPDVQCSESMAVHCIYAGPLLFDSKMWNLDSYLSIE